MCLDQNISLSWSWKRSFIHIYYGFYRDISIPESGQNNLSLHIVFDVSKNMKWCFAFPQECPRHGNRFFPWYGHSWISSECFEHLELTLEIIFICVSSLSSHCGQIQSLTWCSHNILTMFCNLEPWRMISFRKKMLKIANMNHIILQYHTNTVYIQF